MGNSLKDFLKRVKPKKKDNTFRWLFIKKAEGVLIPIAIPTHSTTKALTVELALASRLR